MKPGPATFYVVIEGQLAQWSGTIINSMKAVRVTQKEPSHLGKNQVAVKFTVAVPVEAFKPLSAEAVINVPIDFVQRAVEVEAVAPSSDEAAS